MGGWKAAGAGLALLGALTVGAAEAAGATGGAGERAQIYAGGGAGMVLALAGLFLAVKLAQAGRNPAAGKRFLIWWVSGMLIRMMLLLGFAGIFAALFVQPAAALLALAASYLVAMLIETAWAAKKIQEPSASLNTNL